jgi:transposase
LLLRDAEQVPPDDAVLLVRLRQEAVVETAYQLGQHFVQIVRQRQHDQLDTWFAACQTSKIPDLQSFAAGLKQDEAAVRAALTAPWSNGRVEGQTTRLKMLKRHMYGRASFDLLRQRVVYAA